MGFSLSTVLTRIASFLAESGNPKHVRPSPPKPQARILVDYDNILEATRRQGVQVVVDRLLSSIGTAVLSDCARAEIRLYGGWYETNRLTRDAQALTSKLLASFPQVATVVDKDGSCTLVASAELARSLIIEPHYDLMHTYRQRGLAPGLKCDPPPFPGCAQRTCPLMVVHTFLSTKKCPEPACMLEPPDILHRGEQKLVDAMITADLIELSLSVPDILCIVSSDDDLWPGIRTALAKGASIVHVNTRPPRPLPSFYSVGIRRTYTIRHL